MPKTMKKKKTRKKTQRKATNLYTKKNKSRTSYNRNKPRRLYNKNTSKIKQRSRKRRKKRRLKKWVIPTTIILIVILITAFHGGKKDSSNLIEHVPNSNKDKLKADYHDCLVDTLSLDELNVDSLNDELNELLKDYPVSVYYENIEKGYSYSYNDSEVYYAASTIKMVDALYFYDQVLNDNLDYDSKMKYLSSYHEAYSPGTKNYNNNDLINIKELVDFAILYSDNTAHKMLVTYFGKDKLRNYGISLGAKYTQDGSDNFGHININDSMIYLKHLYKLFNNKKYGNEIRSIFSDSDQNYLKDSLNLTVAHKYGNYNSFYHDLAIVYNDSPYYLVILSQYGEKDYQKMIEIIGKKINEYHEKIIELQQNYCYDLYYNE